MMYPPERIDHCLDQSGISIDGILAQNREAIHPGIEERSIVRTLRKVQYK